MALEIVNCVVKVSVKIYQTVDEVQANKKRCQRLSERIRCLVTPLNDLVEQGGNSSVYKEALIDLVKTLEEARQFLKTFTKGKSVLRRLRDVCYANRVKATFEELNERLNSLVPALTFGLQVECRKTVQETFSASTRLTEDTKDESGDLKDIQHMVNAFGLPSFNCIRSAELKEKKQSGDSNLYFTYTAKYRMSPVRLKKPKFELTSSRKEQLLTDARNMLQFNSENVVRVFGLCVDVKDTFIIVMEHMKHGSLREVLTADHELSRDVLARFAVESARGLYFVHCCDVIHGNLSSTKFLVNEDWRVKISGFEFSGSEPQSSLSEEKRCCFPPENSEGGRGSVKADVYNFGLVLCEIIFRLAGNRIPNDSTCCHRAETFGDLSHPHEVIGASLNADPMLRPTMEEVVIGLTPFSDPQQTIK